MPSRVQSIHDIEYNLFCGFVAKVTGWEGFQRRDVPKTPLVQLSAELFEKSQPLLPGCLIDEDISSQVGQKRLLFYAPEPGKETFKTCLVRKCYQTIVNNLRELICPPILLNNEDDEGAQGREKQVFVTGPSGTGLSTFIYFLMASMIDGSWLDDSGGLIIPTAAHPKQETRDPSCTPLSIQGYWKITRKSIHWIPIDENSQPCKIWQSDKHKSNRQSEPSLKTFWTVYETPLNLDNVTLPTYRSIIVTPLEQIESKIQTDSSLKRLLVLPRWTTVDILLAFLWSLSKTERNSATIVSRLLHSGPIPRIIFSSCSTDGREEEEPYDDDIYSNKHMTNPWAKDTPFIVWWKDRTIFEKIFERGSHSGSLPTPLGIQFRSKAIAEDLLQRTDFREALLGAGLHELIPNFSEIETAARSQPRTRIRPLKLRKETVNKSTAEDAENIKPPTNISQTFTHENEHRGTETETIIGKKEIVGAKECRQSPELPDEDLHNENSLKLGDNEYSRGQISLDQTEVEPITETETDQAEMILDLNISSSAESPDKANVTLSVEHINSEEKPCHLAAVRLDGINLVESERVVGLQMAATEESTDTCVLLRRVDLYEEESQIGMFAEEKPNVEQAEYKTQMERSRSLTSSPTKDSMTAGLGCIELIEPATAAQSFPTRLLPRESSLLDRKNLDPLALAEGSQPNEDNDTIMPPIETVISSPCRVEISGESSGESLTPQFHYLERDLLHDNPNIITSTISPSAQCTVTTQQATRIQDRSQLLATSRSASETRLLQQDISILEAQKDKAAREVRVCEAALVTMKRKLTELVTEHLVADGSKRCRISSNGS